MLNKLQTLCVFLVFQMLFVALSTKAVFSYEFVDTFDNFNTNTWSYMNNQDGISFINSSIVLSSNSEYFPFVLLKDNDALSETNYQIQIKFKYDKVRPNGVGIGVGYIRNPGVENEPFYQYGVWWDTTGAPFLVVNNFNNDNYGNCSNFSHPDDLDGRLVSRIGLQVNGWYVFNLIVLGDKQTVEITDTVNGSKVISKQVNGNCQLKDLWFGNPIGRGNNWSGLTIDHIKISTLDDNRIRIIIPGLGASWNTEGMLSGSTSPDLLWTMTPYVNNYKNIKLALDQNSLVEGKDYFVWNYDWRLPVKETVKRLDAFIDSKIVEENTKVDLIGHSLGGLVARLWAQEEKDKSRLGQIITLGSPHSGAVNAFEAWSGASLENDNSVSYIALKVLLQLQRRKSLSEVATIRNYSPVLKDLLPTFDYLKLNGKTIAPNEIKNDYLLASNILAQTIYENLEAVGSNSQKTKRWINLKTRDVYDQVLGYWPQGKPASYLWESGDGTVLWDSAKFDDDSFTLIDSDHASLPNKSIRSVMEKLELEGVDLPYMADNYQNKAVFFLGSPALLKVDCGEGQIVSEDFAISGIRAGSNCVVEVVGNGNGVYHLVSGKVGMDTSWNYYESEIKTGEVDKYYFGGESLGLIGQSDNLNKWWKEVELSIMKLKAGYSKYKFSEIDKQVKSKNAWNTALEIFKFRASQKEELVSNVTLASLRNILLSTTTSTATKAKQGQTQALQDMSLSDRMTKLYERQGVLPSVFGAREYKTAEDEYARSVIDMGKKQYSNAEVEARLAGMYANNVWR